MDAEIRGAFDALRSDIDHRFGVVGQQFEAVDARFEAVDARFDGIDARFDRVDARFDRMDARFDRMDARFDDVLHQFRIISEDMRDTMRILAEGIVMNSEEILRVRRDLDALRGR